MRINRNYFYILIFVFLKLMLNGCAKKPNDSIDDKITKSFLAQDTPESVLENLKTAYNFNLYHNLNVDSAKSAYRNLIDSTRNPAIYWSDWSGYLKGGVWYYDMEIALTDSIFNSHSNSDSTRLEIINFIIEKEYIEKSDTGKGLDEDWYVYQVDYELNIHLPNSRYWAISKNKSIFYIRKCSDQKYRLARWSDNSLDPSNDKNYITSWGQIRAMYSKLYPH